ncbi:hypothetical protein Cs308_0775 [Candidatus Chlamydia sanziniae]|uniref:Uncharacterized protein n=1 Tax=Candidatus Chlamydia sanziniae TaxID=1806891 RepID=A0A1A9HVS8_9CHLA|nr:hypothetical protein Cs308_0775 [Candidatus Chlamydia sanziniae]
MIRVLHLQKKTFLKKQLNNPIYAIVPCHYCNNIRFYEIL